jgi:hypothetical protein
VAIRGFELRRSYGQRNEGLTITKLKRSVHPGIKN